MLLKCNCGGDLLARESHSKGGSHQLVLHIVGAIDHANDVRIVFLYRLGNAQKVYVQLLGISAEHTGNVAVIDGIDQIVIRFVMHVADGAVDPNVHHTAKIRLGLAAALLHRHIGLFHGLAPFCEVCVFIVAHSLQKYKGNGNIFYKIFFIKKAFLYCFF